MNQKQLNDALLTAAQEGLNSEIIGLIEEGAEIDARDRDQWTPLHCAAWNGFTETCGMLLDAGAEIDARNDDQWTPLHCAAWYGHAETCQRLIEAGANIDVRDGSKWTPLHRAAKSGHTDTYERRIETCLTLIAFGACSESLDPSTNISGEIKALAGITARQAAVQSGLNARLLELLKNHPSDRAEDQIPALIALAEKCGIERTAHILRAHNAHQEAHLALQAIGSCGRLQMP